MARSAKRPPSSVTLQHPVEVTAHRAGFELFEAVAHLDVTALERTRRAELEVGFVRSGGCRQIVRAVIRKGQVTGLRTEPCEEDRTRPLPADLVRAVRAAMRRLAPGGERPAPFPLPVARFLANAGPITVDVLVCVRICVLGACITCCRVLGKNVLTCGRVTIDTTVPS